MTTQQRDLRTGRSVWETRRAPAVTVAPLKGDIETDVLIIGAGITGAMIADALAGSGLGIAMVDKRGPAKGSTTASTALVQYEIDTPLIHLSRKIGPRDAARAWRRSRLAVDAVAARMRELGVPGVSTRDTLYLVGNLLDADALKREGDARQSIGLASRFVDAHELRTDFGVRADAAIVGYGDLVLDPRRTARALLQSAHGRGVSIHAPVEIVDLDARRAMVTATAGNGRRIRCRHLIFATGYELPDGVGARGHKIVSTWAMATAPQPRRLWPGQCMIWEAAKPYLYIRTTPEGRVICGGEDEDFADEPSRDALLTSKTRTLERKLAKLLPGIDAAAELSWTGSFGESAAGLPTIGRIPDLPNCWAALGYGGNGITYSRIAADIIAGALTGRPDIDAELFDFSGKPRSAAS